MNVCSSCGFLPVWPDLRGHLSSVEYRGPNYFCFAETCLCACLSPFTCMPACLHELACVRLELITEVIVLMAKV